MAENDHRPIALPDGSVVQSDPEIHSGAAVFVGTRVPVQTFLNYLEGGHGIDEFLDHFPSVRREQVIAFLEHVAKRGESALLSEQALAEDWNRPEEDEAWAHLQRDR